MKLIALNCRQCGAPLSVPDDVKHVTCIHCGTQLGVVHEGGAAYTEKLEQLDQRTGKMADEIDDLKRQQKIFALDQAWEQEKLQYPEAVRQADKDEPSDATSPVIVVMFMTLLAFVLSLVIPFIFLVLPYSVWLVAFLVVNIENASDREGVDHYRKAEQTYQRRRAELIRSKTITYN